MRRASSRRLSIACAISPRPAPITGPHSQISADSTPLSPRSLNPLIAGACIVALVALVAAPVRRIRPGRRRDRRAALRPRRAQAAHSRAAGGDGEGRDRSDECAEGAGRIGACGVACGSRARAASRANEGTRRSSSRFWRASSARPPRASRRAVASSPTGCAAITCMARPTAWHRCCRRVTPTSSLATRITSSTSVALAWNSSKDCAPISAETRRRADEIGQRRDRLAALESEQRKPPAAAAGRAGQAQDRARGGEPRAQGKEERGRFAAAG